MEYLFANSATPSGHSVHPWMNLKANSVMTNNLQLVYDGDTAPSVNGIPGARDLVVRYRNNLEPAATMSCLLPENQTNVMQPILHSTIPNDVTATSVASNPLRITPLAESSVYLGFRFMRTNSEITGSVAVSIDFNVFRMEQSAASIPPGQPLLFNIQAFSAYQSDFSDEVALTGDLGSDRMYIQASGFGTTTPTNRQLCRFVIEVPASPINTNNPVYIRFKIGRNMSTTDFTTIWWDGVTLSATYVDYE